jgi:hypothetical protein
MRNYYASLRTSILFREEVEDGFRLEPGLESEDDIPWNDMSSPPSDYQSGEGSSYYDEETRSEYERACQAASGEIDFQSSSPKPTNLLYKKIEKPRDFPWDFRLFPLQSKEKRKVIREHRWSSLIYRPDGGYKVAPIKPDIRNFQRKFWIYRNIQQILLIGSMDSKAVTISDLLWVRRTILKFLGNGSRRQTAEQRSLLSQTYYALRKHKPSTRRG